jgi:hypothetical protein
MRFRSDVERQSDTGRHLGSMTYTPIVNTPPPWERISKTKVPVGSGPEAQPSRSTGRSRLHVSLRTGTNRRCGTAA